MWKDFSGISNFLGLKNQMKCVSSLHTELETLTWTMESMFQYSTCQHFGTYCKDLISMIQNQTTRPNFSMELKELTIIRKVPRPQIFYHPRAQNRSVDSLAKTALAFYMNFFLLVVIFRSSLRDDLLFE